MPRKPDPGDPYAGIPREGSNEGPRVFYCPEHQLNGHLTAAGTFIPHASPEGFEPDGKGGIRPVTEKTNG